MSDRRAPDLDRRLLGDLLVEAGIASRQAIGSGLEEQRLRGGRLGYNLLKLGLATPTAMHLFLKDHLDVMAPELVDTLRRSPAVDLIPARLAHYYGMVPVGVEDGVLTLGMTTADLPALIPAVEELTGLRVDPFICPPSTITDVLERFYPSEAELGVLYRPGADHVFILSDQGRGIRPVLPELLRVDCPAADRLRALLAEAVRCGARRLRIEPRRDSLRVTLCGRRTDDREVAQPRGAYVGLVRFIEGLAGIAPRGRVVPREGRFLLLKDGRRLVLSVGSMPGLEGDSLTLDLREERFAEATRDQIETEQPELVGAVDRLTAEKRGLLIVTGSDAVEATAGIDCLRAIMGERGARFVGPLEAGTPMPADDSERPFEVLLETALRDDPDILILPELARPGRASAACEQAEARIVIATVTPMIDACAAVEWLGRSGLGRRMRGALAGVLGTRLMERLCDSCRRPVDPLEFLLPAPLYRRPRPGAYGVAHGCDSCRLSGRLMWEPVFEFVRPVPGDDLFLPPVPARILREERARRGMSTLFLAGLTKAAAGIVDLREPLRLLLHER